MHVSSRPKKSRLLPDGAENTQVAEAVGDIYDSGKKQGLEYFQLQTQAGIFPMSPLSRE